MKKFFKFFLTVSIILFLFGCSEKKESVDLVLMNGKVATVDDDNPEAEAIAVKGDTIVAVGSNSEIKNYIGGATKVIDLKGKFVMPGFFESHAHFDGLGAAKMSLDLTTANNWDEIISKVAEAAEKALPGEWIVGRGWHREKWDPVPEPNYEGYPYHKVLSQATPRNPVMLTHASGHAIFANIKAMQIAGITSSTPDPDGGRIVRDSTTGEAIGVFEETAEDLIAEKYREYLDKRTEEQKKADDLKKYNLATEECLSKGITSFVDAGEPFSTIDIFKEMADEGKLDLRLYVMVLEDNKSMREKLTDYKMIGYANNFLTVRSIKEYVDGALGSRGAWMLEPYEDLPGHTGLNVTPLKDLRETAQIAIENGFQMCTHAIGDRGNREMLDIYENTFKKYPDKKDLRWRIEHAQHLSAQDIPRFAKLGVIAAMQTCHCTSDAVFVIKRLGEARAEEGAYVWRKLIDSGATICNGTDAPVEEVDPIPNYYSAVTRKLSDGSTFYPDQKMTRMEALKSYTINGAYASFQEDKLGSLEPGKLADITVLSQDLLTVPDDQILNTNVLYTIVGGKIKYQSAE
jgi:predicted amidohydrolase YtcJ